MLPSDLKVTHGIAQVNGLRCHYVEMGNGPLLLLLHGFPENWWSWRYQLEPLAAAGYRVVAPDQRGYQGSARTGPYDLDTLAGDVAALISALGEKKAHVVGHDWGGAVAYHLAATHPDLVDTLAVLNCPHPAKMMKALRSSGAQVLRSWYMFWFQVPYLPEQVLTRLGHRLIPRMYRAMSKDRAHFMPEELRPFIEGARQPGAARAMIGWYRAAFWKAMRRDANPAAFRPIQAETLLLWAMDDLALRYDDLVPGTERWVPKLQIKTLEHCGHFLQAEQPERVNEALLQFLGKARAVESSRETKAREVTVVLSHAGENIIRVIKEVREITGLNLKDVRELVESAPMTLKEGVHLEDAERMQRQLTAAGAKVELR